MRAPVQHGRRDRSALGLHADVPPGGHATGSGRDRAGRIRVRQQGAQFCGRLLALRIVQTLEEVFDAGPPHRRLEGLCLLRPGPRREFCRAPVQPFQLHPLQLAVAPPEPPRDPVAQFRPRVRRRGLHDRGAPRRGQRRQ
ncbi:hypothetical protein OG730_17935 [Streptomyces sp. NBC_01298]|uniref:hypothetical protein n=1 Tax=Streptomyces sp. NBC_01298 TaxID=2903817 RepID=UPI002E0FA316|nr:hypothetical protein OG730_17935 [Streptomyces sp. NBC_01298]